MKTLELEGNDLKMAKNRLAVIEGEKEVAQSLATLLSIRKGEFFLDEYIGLERDSLLGKNSNKEEARDDIIECLSQDNRVELVSDVSVLQEGRHAKITFAAKLTDATELGEEVEINA